MNSDKCSFCSLKDHCKNILTCESNDFLKGESYIKTNPEYIREWHTGIPSEPYYRKNLLVLAKSTKDKNDNSIIPIYAVKKDMIRLHGDTMLYSDLRNYWSGYTLEWIPTEEILLKKDIVRGKILTKIKDNLIPELYKCSECECKNLCKRDQSFLCGAHEFILGIEKHLNELFSFKAKDGLFENNPILYRVGNKYNVCDCEQTLNDMILPLNIGSKVKHWYLYELLPEFRGSLLEIQL